MSAGRKEPAYAADRQNLFHRPRGQPHPGQHPVRGIPQGDKLPAEMELCELLHVGRSTVREALRVLQAMGLVEIRHGKGAFVTDRENARDS